MVEDAPIDQGLPAPVFAILYLPLGLANGFVGVTLGYVLGHHGVTVAAVAGLTGLFLIPTIWSFAAGPVIDVSFSPRAWHIIMIGALAGCFVGFAMTPMNAAALPQLGVLCFVASASAVCVQSAATALMVSTTPPNRRAPIAGWAQTANMGGAGLGGGLALWIVGHVGGTTAAALVVAALTLCCAAPLRWLRPPEREAGVPVVQRFAELKQAIWGLAGTRPGRLAILLVVMPAALGAAVRLLPAAADQWRATSDVVALASGALGGATTIPGCLLGGYLSRRIAPHTVFLGAAVAYSIGLAAMAIAPHTPLAFAGFLIANGFILGVALGAMHAVIFQCLGTGSAATVNGALNSLSNLPLLAVTFWMGRVEGQLGVSAMLLTEAGLGLAAVTIYGLVLRTGPSLK